jgi:hypothetical protein
VRIHTDEKADSLAGSIQAKAFTVGNDIAFAKGEYKPESSSGKHLIAHELGHVVQQGGGDNAAIQRTSNIEATASTTGKGKNEKGKKIATMGLHADTETEVRYY